MNRIHGLLLFGTRPEGRALLPVALRRRGVPAAGGDRLHPGPAALERRPQLREDQLAPDGHGAHPGQQVAADAGDQRTEGHLIGRHLGLEREIGGDEEEGDAAEALGAPDLGGSARMPGNAMPSAAPFPFLPFLPPLALPLALLLSLAIVVSSLAGGPGCSDQVAAGPRPGRTHALEHEADEPLAVVLGNLLKHQGPLAVLADANDTGAPFSIGSSVVTTEMVKRIVSSTARVSSSESSIPPPLRSTVCTRRRPSISDFTVTGWGVGMRTKSRRCRISASPSG